MACTASNEQVQKKMEKLLGVMLQGFDQKSIYKETADEILKLLRRINSQGTAVLMATHKLHLAESAQKRILRIKDGRVENWVGSIR